jgi:esterase/lipase superfamily enzyme
MRVTEDEVEKIVLQYLAAAFKVGSFSSLKGDELWAAIRAITKHVSKSLKLNPLQAFRLLKTVQNSFSVDSFTVGQTKYALTGANLALLIWWSLDQGKMLSDDERSGSAPEAEPGAAPQPETQERHHNRIIFQQSRDVLVELKRWLGPTATPAPQATQEPPIVKAEPEIVMTEPEAANRRRRQGPVPRIVKTEYVVWYGTNRCVIRSDGVPTGYSAARGSKVHYGMCRVYIPRAHKIGSLGSPWWKRLLTWTDDRLRLMKIKELRQELFWQQIASQLSKLTVDERNAVIFVHGYNVWFKDAAIRAAQIGFDLSIKGAMAFFSWPSQGAIGGYMADAATIEASEQDITNFMIDFVTKSGAESVHIIAHSMGNRGVLRAVNRIAGQAQQRSGVPFGQIVLAAADVDSDTFRQLCGAYAQIARRTTLYISERDRAVEASHWLHQFPRAGLMPPICIASGIDTIAVTNVDLTLLGHGYIGEAREILTDIHQLITTGAPPDQRFGVTASSTPTGERYWLIRG